MALGTLTLSTTSGVQGRSFAAKVSGLTTGKVEVVGSDGSPGFSISNGIVYSNGLPYTVSTVVLREYDPGAATSVKETRIDIQAATPSQIAAQAASMVTAPRVVVAVRVAPVMQPDGSTSYFIYVTDDLGATLTAPCSSSADALTINGDPITINGEILTLRSA
jgi:hypothetical protein